MSVNVKELRRLYEADCADERKARPNRKPQGAKFLSELTEGLDSGEIKPTDFSIRGLMEEFICDAETGAPIGREIVDSWNPKRGGASDGENLTKLVEGGAVTSAMFANITGQIIYNATLESYQSEDFVFTAEIPTVDTQFSGERVAGIGGIGNQAEVVPEGALYPMVGVTEDYIDTPATTKRGMILPLTKEAAFFDRTGLLIARASEVGLYLGINKEIRAIDCTIDENTTVHRYNRKQRGAVATYGDNSGNHDWDNLQASNALVNWVQVDNADQLLYTILDPNTGLPIVITGRTKLVVSRGLLKTAQYIQRAGSLTIVNPGFATSGNPTETNAPNIVPEYEILTSRLLATRQAATSSWYYGAPDKAFRYMQNWPLTVVEAPANSEMEFQQDIAMRWKASERGQYATFDPRYIVKCTA
jgi:hypothetical protein